MKHKMKERKEQEEGHRQIVITGKKTQFRTSVY